MKEKILKLAWHLKSDHVSVLACICIALAQSLHTYYIVLYSSRLNDNLALLQAILISTILSLGLLINIFKSGSIEDEHLRKKFKSNSWWFATIEVIINIHYWAKTMIYNPYISNKPLEIYDFIAALLLSIAIPWILYSYAGHIKIPEFNDIHRNGKVKITIKGTEGKGNDKKYIVETETL